MTRAIVLLQLLSQVGSADEGEAAFAVLPAIGIASLSLGTATTLTFTVLDVLNRRRPDSNLGNAELASMGPTLVVDLIMMGVYWPFARLQYTEYNPATGTVTEGYEGVNPVELSIALWATVETIWTVGLLAHGAWLTRHGRDFRVSPTASASGGGLVAAWRF